MKFKEIYCSNCKKILGRYNLKFYNEDKIGEIINIHHGAHVRSGHHVIMRDFVKNNKLENL